jgi:hypothetical protein
MQDAGAAGADAGATAGAVLLVLAGGGWVILFTKRKINPLSLLLYG